jgi:uncharacterized protein (TIRG00374 family)
MTGLIGRFLLFLISLLIGSGLFTWIGKMVGWQGISDALAVFTGWQGLAIFGLTILMALVGTWKWKEILKGIEIKIPFRALFGPYLTGFAIMFLAPILIWGGEIFRGYVLKNRNSIPWSKGMASVIIDRILEWTANLAVIFLGGIFFLSVIGFPPTKLAIIFGGLFLIFFAGIFFFYFKSIKKESMVKFFIPGGQDQPLEVEKEIFAFFRSSKKSAVWKTIGLSFLRAAIMYFRAFILILFLGKNIGVLPALSVLGFSYLAVIIPIPAALGSHEAIQTFAFNSLGLGASTAAAFTMIIRGAELIIALLGLIFLFRLGIIIIKNVLFKKVENLIKNNNN